MGYNKEVQDNILSDAVEYKGKQKRAIITGIGGQAASYLAELLLSKGYKVYGIYRRTTSPSFKNIQHLINDPNLVLECGDITDCGFIFSCYSKIQPDEIYNLAAQSFVKISFDQPIHTFDVDTIGVMNQLEWVKQCSPTTKFYQASTSEMFGRNVSYEPIKYVESITLSNNKVWRRAFQDENTAFIPQSPYAIAKLAAHHLCRLYREAYGLFIVSNITFNHESPRRGKEFVTRKITNYIGRLVAECNIPCTGTPPSNNGIDCDPSIKPTNNLCLIPEKVKQFPKLQLGNIYSYRDWGHAKDYMWAAYLAMHYDRPQDYVVCTGVTHSVEDFLSLAFEKVGLNWKDFVVISEEFKRPAEVDFLCGENKKIRSDLGWTPQISFKDLVDEMVTNDITECINAKV